MTDPRPISLFPQDKDGPHLHTQIHSVEKNTKKPVTKKAVVRRRKNTHIACVNCSKWHLSCEASRPCHRCVSKNIADTCIDVPRKRTKYLDGISDAQWKHSLAPNNNNNNNNTVVSKPVMSIARRGIATSPSNPRQDFIPAGSPNTNQHSPKEKTPSISPSYDMSSNYNSPSESANAPTFAYPSQFQNVYKNLLGPNSDEIINSGANLFMDHFPLVPVQSTNHSLDFKRYSDVSTPSSDSPLPDSPNTSSFRYDAATNQYYLNNTNKAYPEIIPIIQAKHPPVYKDPSTSNLVDKPGFNASLVLAASFPHNNKNFTNSNFIKSNSHWEHSLRYSKPMDIYTKIDQPFSHTRGFHYLLSYIKKRFPRDDVVSMCRSLAEFRPVFLESAVTLTEEDMIFVEQSYQRTLLEYTKHISKVGVPTCIWRRNGQISYMNEEFEILTGWTRKELLNKMTFIVEIMDDDSVRSYFKTFSTIAYKDFKGCEQMKTCRLITPIKGQVIACECIWTLKRDFAGLPLMIIANFMPTFQLQHTP
ncbi:hypothetical protein TBLA_0D03550 [Henningerozyma blattae CBS 6284]|uniref:PAS domain-containing protein n=1 Tax=Henningerozyma blattae (strain ATCC 34711 / CBS 6284 / DSM 70876 / NBRC 10599 / NRRL Y-10934 / UCD 77-7) TaxID=1071380 RepID=I2H3A3_HENB6|nr:hypothetical protein TBLA_0D03550 [Tetrapisispora blattae CBS 6284]CCH60855.1 hypothetical protein TBLA_0D03550 [Tetrapisispora blattae CBS 6284]